MKKLISVLLCLALTVSLAACGAQAPAETTAGTAATNPAEPAGSVIAAMGAVFELVYDQGGVILALKGLNASGEEIAAACQQYVGRACVHGIRGLMRYCADNQLIGNAKTFSVRVRAGDPLPDEEFLETIITDTQYLADEECTGVQMVKLDETRLTEEGFIDEATASYMAALFLQAHEEDITVSALGADRTYTVTYGEATCTVDAVTGLVEG